MSIEELLEMVGQAVLIGVSLVVLRSGVGQTVEISGSGPSGSTAGGGGSS